MKGADWNSATHAIATGLHGNGWYVEAARIRHNITSYFIPSFENDALLFSLPVLFSRSLTDEIRKDPAGSDGAVHCIIEQIKRQAHEVPALGPLAATGTRYPQRYDVMAEPYTVIHSAEAIGAHLWHSDDHNFCDSQGVHLLIRGALPNPSSYSPASVRQISDAIAALLDAINRIIS